MKEQKENHSIMKMAELLNVSKSGYYKWLKAKPNKFKRLNDELVAKITGIQEKCKFSIGAIKVTEALKKSGYFINHKRISRLMNINNLNFKKKKKFKLFKNPVSVGNYCSNILNREFTALKPNEKWVSDITYLWSKEGWLYLCVIIDLFSRKVVAYSLSKKIDTELVLEAFRKAVFVRKPCPGLIFHSDRGVQYNSDAFKEELKKNIMIQSMSRKGNCWDNACAETFFRSLKTEWFYDEYLLSEKEIKLLIFEYIEIFYNRSRAHYTLNLKTPVDYEKRFEA